MNRKNSKRNSSKIRRKRSGGAQKGVLIDAVNLHKAHPKTFQIPPSDLTKHLKKGDFAKVNAPGERFWVEITKADSKGNYIGRVDNELVGKDMHGLKLHDIVHFSWRNVIDIGG